jgi:hypothetical protein
MKTSEAPVEYDVVDGQQRLIAIYEFLDDELPLSAESQKEFKAAFYSELSDDISDAFDDFEIYSDEIEEASETEIKEFLQRLQEELPLTSSEKLNSVESKLRDFCRKLAKNKIFAETVTLTDRRYAYFDVCAKAAAIEVEGTEVGLRYEEIKAVFESQVSFSTKSLVAKRPRSALYFLHKYLPGESKILHNRSIIQSLITLACQLVKGETTENAEKFSVIS